MKPENLEGGQIDQVFDFLQVRDTVLPEIQFLILG